MNKSPIRAMAFEQRDGLDPDPRARIAAIDRGLVTDRVGPRDASVTVRRHAPPTDHRMDAQAPLFGVGSPQEHDRARAFPGEKPGRVTVVDPHGALRERPQAGEADQLERVEADVEPQAAIGDRAEGAPSCQRVAPQLVERSRVGVTTADPDDRDIRTHVLRSRALGAARGAPAGSKCERRATATASRAHSVTPRRTQTAASAKNRPYTTWST